MNFLIAQFALNIGPTAAVLFFAFYSFPVAAPAFSIVSGSIFYVASREKAPAKSNRLGWLPCVAFAFASYVIAIASMFAIGYAISAFHYGDSIVAAFVMVVSGLAVAASVQLLLFKKLV